VHACPGCPAAQPRHQGPGEASEEPWQERKADHLRGDAQAAAYRLRGAQIRSALRPRTGACSVRGKTVSTDTALSASTEPEDEQSPIRCTNVGRSAPFRPPIRHAPQPRSVANAER